MTSTPPTPSAGQEREAFEAFMRDSRRNRGVKKAAELLNRFEDGTYINEHVQRHWWTWQQARAALASASKQAGGELVAYYNGNWTLTPRAYADAIKRDPAVFADMKPAYAAPQTQQAEPSDAEVAAFVGRTVGTWREYDRDDVLKLAKAALKAVQPIRMCECGTLPHTNSCSWEHPNEPKPAPLNGGCGDGESDHG
ncbi:hypothetical protein J2W34_000092 [Variovorax boronicumulans]|uniref:hypothetical protein n=1 Tax=Variovorax boronicumulans TaxID=436515 RepID=UPI00277E28B7|nr:hypothetical protein [Variovorax boronicumulans]MDQ0068318.1 hypothetical protein [Variovorax boronicumulans]